MLTLLSVNNLSGAAYTLLAEPSGFTHHYAKPAEICRKVQQQQCDAALLPVACLESASRQYEPLGAYGIACKGAVGSVLLFCDLPLENSTKEHLPIFISEDSSTSRLIFQQLYQKKFGHAPTLTSDATKAFARVYIGNESLIMKRTRHPNAQVVDLGEWWHQETRLPCVFARWVVRRGLPESDKEKLLDWLEHSTRYALSAKGKQHMVETNADLFVSNLSAVEYYDRLRFRLEQDELAGLDYFLTSTREMNACPRIA